MFLKQYLYYGIGIIILILIGLLTYYKINYNLAIKDTIIAEGKVVDMQNIIDAQKKANEALLRNNEILIKVTDNYHNDISKIKQEIVRKDNELKKAIKNNPEWSNTPIPDSVWDALQEGDSRSAPTIPHTR